MLKCPYCYNELSEKTNRCPHCSQYIIDDLVSVAFPSVDKKECVFCGKKILREAKICEHCHKWLDEVDRMVQDIDFDDLYED